MIVAALTGAQSLDKQAYDANNQARCLPPARTGITPKFPTSQFVALAYTLSNTDTIFLELYVSAVQLVLRVLD